MTDMQLGETFSGKVVGEFSQYEEERQPGDAKVAQVQADDGNVVINILEDGGYQECSVIDEDGVRVSGTLLPLSAEEAEKNRIDGTAHRIVPTEGESLAL